MEAVLLSTPQSFIAAKLDDENNWATSLNNYKENIDIPLSAILSLNTIAHTVGAAGVGAQAIKVFGEAYFGIASAILTLLILIVTEIIPKTLGAIYWRRLASTITYFIKATIFIAYPLVKISSLVTNLLSRANKRENTISREEIVALANIGADEGVFSEKEGQIIQNLLKLKNVKVKEIMTPRIVVAVADENITLKEFLENKEYLKFSRIPVYSGNDENITGYVIREIALEKMLEEDRNLKLKDIKRKIIIVPYSAELFSTWETLLEKREHIVLIVDEYGGMDGIVTMEDIIEALLGLEIVDETDTITNMQEYARSRWKARQAKYNLLENLQKDIKIEN